MNPNNNSAVILFDGVCNLCNGAVQFVLRRDRNSKFRFASLQSGYAQALMHHFNLQNDLQSILLYENGKIYQRSEAALRIAQHLNGFRWLRILRIIPTFIRDGVYNLVARTRYKVFGKRDACMIPSPVLKDRFVDDKQFQPQS